MLFRSEAYDILTTPDRRAQWEHERQYGNQQQGPGGFSFNFGFPGADINEIFRQFTSGGGFHGFRAPQRNRDLRMGIEIDLESTLTEQKHHVNVQNTNGTNKTVEIRIPRGVQTGMQMKFSGHGDQANPSLPAGDLYVEFRVRAHPDFQVHGIHLSKLTKINCIDAMLGSKIQVVGLDGKTFEINTPPATQHGTRFRVPGQGLWDVNQPIRGDLFVEVVIQVPTAPTVEQLDRLQKLKI